MTSSASRLGSEPCGQAGEAYDAWGTVAPWDGVDNVVPTHEFPMRYRGWVVRDVSQKYGIVGWLGERDDDDDDDDKNDDGMSTLGTDVGQRVRIWPNHACIAGPRFDEYLVWWWTVGGLMRMRLWMSGQGGGGGRCPT
jgi:hypothetical protein